MYARNLLSSALLLTGLAAGQSVVSIDSNGLGCAQDGALLSDGSIGSATVEFDYDADTAILRVSVANTSPVVPGVPNPVITRVYFNVPTGTTTTATLIGQTGSGITPPDFVFGFDPNAGDSSNPNHAGCFGSFNFRLASAGIADGIVNPEAELICADTKEPLLFGATFVLQLEGPDVRWLSSEVFAASTSRNAGLRPVNVAVKFDGAGCEGNGTIGNGDLCRTAVFLRGVPDLGESISVCVEGSNQCRAFLGVSAEAGPTEFKKFTMPIGQPVLFTFDFGFFPPNGSEFCLPIQIPLDRDLQGMTFYWTSLTHPYLEAGPYSFAPAFAFTVGSDQNQQF